MGKGFSNLTSLFAIGCLEAIWAPVIPYVKRAFELDEAQLGLMLLCPGLGSILVVPFAGSLCKHYGVKPLVYISLLLAALALMVVGLNISPWLTAFLLVIFGVCLGIIDVSSNVNAVVLEKMMQKPLMSGFHGGYSVGTLVGAASTTLLLTLNVSLILTIFLLVTVLLLYALWGCRYLLRKDELSAITADNCQQSTINSQKSIFAFVPPLVLVVGALCFIMYASEGAVMSWSSVYAHQELNVDIRYAGYVYAAFAVTMTCMRLMGNKIVVRFGAGRVVVAGGVIVTCGFLVVAFVHTIAACIVGFAMVGFGAANIVPQLISYAGKLKGMPVPNIISFVNIFGYSGILLGPAVIGFSARTFGLPSTFAGIAACCSIVVIAAYMLRIEDDR